MSEQFQPGDMVECVDASPAANSTTCAPLVLGALYTVRAFHPAGEHDLANRFRWTDNVVELQGDPRPREGFVKNGAWLASRFRKVYRPDAKFIERLTAEPVIMPPVRHPERVDA